MFAGITEPELEASPCTSNVVMSRHKDTHFRICQHISAYISAYFTGVLQALFYLSESSEGAQVFYFIFAELKLQVPRIIENTIAEDEYAAMYLQGEYVIT